MTDLNTIRAQLESNAARILEALGIERDPSIKTAREQTWHIYSFEHQDTATGFAAPLGEEGQPLMAEMYELQWQESELLTGIPRHQQAVREWQQDEVLGEEMPTFKIARVEPMTDDGLDTL